MSVPGAGMAPGLLERGMLMGRLRGLLLGARESFWLIPSAALLAGGNFGWRGICLSVGDEAGGNNHPHGERRAKGQVHLASSRNRTRGSDLLNGTPDRDPSQATA